MTLREIFLPWSVIGELKAHAKWQGDLLWIKDFQIEALREKINRRYQPRDSKGRFAACSPEA